MKRSPVPAIIVLIGLVFLCGCSQPSVVSPAQAGDDALPLTPANPDESLTVTPAILEATPNVTPKIQAAPTASVTQKPVKTPSPEADPADVAKITFSRYSDRDFSIDYPSAWNITKSTYSPVTCTNNLDRESKSYRVCFQKETKSIGPFNFYPDTNYKKPVRIVNFTSADGKIKFVAFIRDFLDSVNGIAVVKPSDEWCRAQFAANYPELPASTTLGNYNTVQSGNTVTAGYDVAIPVTSPYFPRAYTKKDVVTAHRLYSFGFITDNDNFLKYQSLKEKMMSSVTTNDG